MSAILSADDLNDFISPGVACVKPVETLPKQRESSNPYEVTTEDKLVAENPPPASISLTDCLACSGCVTSAEAVLISLQSHTEVLTTLDAHPSFDFRQPELTTSQRLEGNDSKLFVASVSPQVRASLAAIYNISGRQAGYMIEQLLSGPQGLRSGGRYGSSFTYVVDTNRMREACLVLGADEVTQSLTGTNTTPRPILTSACPGWICYAEKTHPHVLPYLSKLKSPQALTGTLLKSILSKAFDIHPSQIWHLAIMPCFDKKLEASREELTDSWWARDHSIEESASPVRDVDCVITSRELLTLSKDRGIKIQALPLTPIPQEYRTPFPCPPISRFLFPKPRRRYRRDNHLPQSPLAGTSGGYLHHILTTQQSLHPGSTLHIQPGRNADVTEYTLVSTTQEPLLKCARFYGFRNIQNLVRKLKPARGSRLPGAAASRRGELGHVRNGVANGASEYAYVEVMACPGGCTNGGGQIRVEEAMAMQEEKNPCEKDDLRGEVNGDSANGDSANGTASSQRQWLKRVDSAYFSASSDTEAPSDPEGEFTISENEQDLTSQNHLLGDNDSHPTPDPDIPTLLSHWSTYTSIPLQKLVYTTYRKVDSDVGKKSSSSSKKDGLPGDTERIAVLAGSIGGGW